MAHTYPYPDMNAFASGYGLFETDSLPLHMQSDGGSSNRTPPHEDIVAAYLSSSSESPSTPSGIDAFESEFGGDFVDMGTHSGMNPYGDDHGNGAGLFFDVAIPEQCVALADVSPPPSEPVSPHGVSATIEEQPSSHFQKTAEIEADDDNDRDAEGSPEVEEPTAIDVDPKSPSPSSAGDGDDESAYSPSSPSSDAGSNYSAEYRKPTSPHQRSPSYHGNVGGPGPGRGAPPPVPVPNLTKKSRGRKVPTSAAGAPAAKKVRSSLSTRTRAATGATDTSPHTEERSVGRGSKKRTYTCVVPGCGKCFVRGEHLKRHVRSIHTWEKRAFSLNNMVFIMQY